MKLGKQEKHVPYKYKVLELFGGIGAPRKALDNIFGACKIKTVDYVDILNWATIAYSKLADTCYLPQDIARWNIDVDIVIHGSPCQDFSLAGLGKGGEIGTGTRSSLLWETIDLIQNKLTRLPKVIIWENVKGVLTKNHKPVFEKYLASLEKLGYVNKYKVLNGVNFGIPQRRERVFVVSILNTATEFQHFSFDNLTLTPTRALKDFLETDVDIKYFIKQNSMIKAIKDGKIKIIDDVVQTITTKQWRWNNAGVVKVPLTTFNAENYIFNVDMATLPTITASGAQSRLKIAIPIIEWKKPEKEPTELCKVGNYTPSNFHAGNVYHTDHVIPTFTGNNALSTGIIESVKLNGTDYEILIDKDNKPLPIFMIDGKPYYVRIITEREAWRLMGFYDTDFDKVKDLPKTALYHLAGNSIIVQVLESIFNELLFNGGV